MKKLVVLLLSCAAIYSCQKATYINPSESPLEMNADENAGQLSLSSDASNFELTYSPSWMKVALNDSILTYNAPENTEAFMRNDSIVVACGGMKINIPVIQYARCTQIRCNDSRINFKKEGETKEVEIITDGYPTVDIEGSNIEAKYSKGILTVTAMPNTGDDPINGKITLSEDEKILTLKYTINGNKCATCQGRGKIKCEKCNGTGIEYMRETGSLELYCTACGGYGGMGSGCEDEGPYRAGSGRVKCPDCGGIGK